VYEWARKFGDAVRPHSSAVIVTHRNADPDAIGAALLARDVLGAYGVRSCVLTPEGVSAQSKSIILSLSLDVNNCGVEHLQESSLAVIVDSSNYTQLGDAADIVREKARLVVDHHAPGTLYDGSTVISDPKAGSTTEILVVVAEALAICPHEAVASVAYAGIYYDTRRLSSPGIYTFQALQYLSECGGKPPKSERRRDAVEFSERYARVVGASRARVARSCGDIIVAVTHVGSFESRVANALVDLGADVAVAVKQERAGYRVAVRVSDRAVKAGVRADFVASYIAEKLGGEGGGHERAGMAHVPLIAGSPEEVADRIARSLPGKVARKCVEARSNGRGETHSIR